MPELEPLTAPDEFIRSLKPAIVRTIGPEYSFSDVLGMVLFDQADEAYSTGRRPTIYRHDNFSDVARSLRYDPSALGILPVENSSTSTVQSVTDELLTGDFKVIAEASLLINLVLAGADIPDLKIEGVKTVLSQTKAFGQARGFIKEHNFEPSEVDSTAKAAEIVAEDGDPKIAALCGIRAADRFGLKIIQKGVQDDPNNQTRFLLVKSVADNVIPDVEDTRGPSWAKVKLAKVAAIVTPGLSATRGLASVLNYSIMRDLEAEPLGHTNTSSMEGRDRDYFMEFAGRPEDLRNALGEQSNYRGDMVLRIVGVYPASNRPYSEGI